MSLRQRIAAFMSPSRTVIEAKPTGPTSDALKAELAHLRDRKDSLEALLAARGDPDAKLMGGQGQSLFRTLSSSRDDSARDFFESKRLQVLGTAHEVYALRGTAANVIEVFLDFCVADGFNPEPKDPKNEKLAELLDEIWADPRNRLNERQEGMCRSALIEGERFIPARLSKIDGHLELGFRGPETVRAILQDDLGRDVFLELDPGTPGGQALKYYVLDSLTENVEITHLDGAGDDPAAPRYRITEKAIGAEGQSLPSKPVDVQGLAFAWFENRPDGAKRGRSELLNILDYVDIHDELLWTDMEISRLLRMFILDVKIEGVGTADEIRKQLEEMGLTSPPDKPKVIGHNEKVEVQLLQGSIAKTASDKLEQIVVKNIYGAKGMPEHFSGSGSDTNLATAQAQELVPMKRLRRKQMVFHNRFRRLVEVSIELRLRAGAKVEDVEFVLTHSEVGGKDKTRGSEVLTKVVTAMSLAVTDQLLSREAANKVIVETVREVGYTIDDTEAALPEQDPAQDLEKIKKLLGDPGNTGTPGNAGNPANPERAARGAA